MLPDGSRLHVVIPDITRRFWSVNIRKFVVRASHLDDLVALGSITAPAARFLDAAVRSGLNVLVSGGTQAGKTTLLNCLAAAVPPQERVVTGEEVFELKIPLPDVVSLQCRQPSLEGTGEIKLRRLVKEALRMRPSRIIVGEVRQEESLDLLIALNSGLPGMGSIHANSAREAITKTLHAAVAGRARTSPTSSWCRRSRAASTWSCTSARRRAVGARARGVGDPGARRGRRRRGVRDVRDARRTAGAGRWLAAARRAFRPGRLRPGRPARRRPDSAALMGALLGLTCGLGILLIVRSFGPPARRRTPRVSRRDKVAEMLRQAGIESVTPGGLAASCAGVGGVVARRDVRRLALAGDRGRVRVAGRLDAGGRGALPAASSDAPSCVTCGPMLSTTLLPRYARGWRCPRR